MTWWAWVLIAMVVAIGVGDIIASQRFWRRLEARLTERR